MKALYPTCPAIAQMFVHLFGHGDQLAHVLAWLKLGVERPGQSCTGRSVVWTSINPGVGISAMRTLVFDPLVGCGDEPELPSQVVRLVTPDPIGFEVWSGSVSSDSWRTYSLRRPELLQLFCSVAGAELPYFRYWLRTEYKIPSQLLDSAGSLLRFVAEPRSLFNPADEQLRKALQPD